MHLILSINNRVVCLLRIVLEAVSQSVQKLIRPAQSPMIVGPTCCIYRSANVNVSIKDVYNKLLPVLLTTSRREAISVGYNKRRQWRCVNSHLLRQAMPTLRMSRPTTRASDEMMSRAGPTDRQTDIQTNWLSSTFNTYRAVCYEQCNSLRTANFVTAGTLTLSPERQSARMSKIANDGLSRSSRRRL